MHFSNLKEIFYILRYPKLCKNQLLMYHNCNNEAMHNNVHLQLITMFVSTCHPTFGTTQPNLRLICISSKQKLAQKSRNLTPLLTKLLPSALLMTRTRLCRPGRYKNRIASKIQSVGTIWPNT